MTDYSSQLFPYAYNILGSAEDARDAVQDVLEKHYAEAREGVENEKAYLIRSVINRAINLKTRRQHTTPPGVWLPEPIATESADAAVYLKDILSYSLLVLLERLNAQERAVFILRESFDYAHEEIGAILSITEAHSRKLLSRAKEKLFKPGDAAHSVSSPRTLALLQDYIGAIRGRDIPRLEQMLAADVAFFADGGSKRKVVMQQCTGAAQVAGLLSFTYHTYQRKSTIRVITVNHQPAFLFYNKTLLVACQVFDISEADGKIWGISTVVDPEKLKGLEDQSVVG